MRKFTTREAILLSAALLALLPREIKTEHGVDAGGKSKLTRICLKSTLFGVDVSNAGDGKKSVGLSILPQSETLGAKVFELSDKIRERRGRRTAIREEKRLRPLFKNALELVAKRGSVDVAYLCRKLAVGQSCAEAFLEMMEEMKVVAAAGNGKYRVIMPKKQIEKLI